MISKLNQKCDERNLKQQGKKKYPFNIEDKANIESNS